MRNYSLAAVERMLRATPPMISVKRNRRSGHITSVQFFPLPQDSAAVEGKEKLRKTAHMGQHYSFAQAVDDSGRRVWRFSPVLVPRDADIESYIMSVFRAVPLSCIAEGRGFRPLSSEEVRNAGPVVSSEFEPEPPTPANVVEMRPRRKAPVDMPAARRAA